MRFTAFSLIAFALLSISAAYGDTVRDQSDSECYRSGDTVTIQGNASAQPITIADGSIKSVWVLTTPQPICVIDSLELTEKTVSNIQIIGSPPPTGTAIELKGTLSTKNITQDYATAINVISGRRISDTAFKSVEAQPFDTSNAANNPVMNQGGAAAHSPTAGVENPPTSDDNKPGDDSPGLFSFLILGAIIIWVAWLYYKKEKEKARLHKALEIIKQHSQELSIRKKQLTIPGAYGIVDDKPWFDDIVFFITQVIEPVIGNVRSVEGNKSKGFYEALYNAINEAALNPQPAKYSAEKKISPIEYERSVALQLQENGWDARTTKGSGDQGIDVIAIKNGVKVVIQCKLYTSPVGNAAVQEIIAGRAFEKADYAVVVSNIGYTKAARQLAANADVLLLHHDELDNLESKLGIA